MSNEIVRQVPGRLQQGDTAWVLEQYQTGQLRELQANLPAADWDALGIALRNGDAAGAQVAVSRYEHFEKAPTRSRSTLWAILAVLALAAIIGGLLIWLSGRNDDDEVVAPTTTVAPTTAAPTTEAPTTTAMQLPTLLEVVRNDQNLSVLVGYAVQAGLQGALEGDAEFTVFAPTNEAFAAAEAALGADLGSVTGDTTLLQQILTYHVVSGRLDPLPTDEVESVEGSTLTLDGDARPRTVNGVEVAEAVPASNGVVYVIDEVLIPPTFVAPTTVAPTTAASTTTTVALQSIPATLVTRGNFTTLTGLVAIAGLDPALSAAGPLTLWAPNDAAFSALPPATLEALRADTALLRQVLTYHVLQGQAAAADLTTRAFRTVQGQDVNVVVGDPVTVNDAEVLTADIFATNGVIHEIDAVLVPPDVTLPG
jgi:transforming growth factor-beta-induced protein